MRKIVTCSCIAISFLMLTIPTVLADVESDFYWVPGNPEPGEIVTFYTHSSFTGEDRYLNSYWQFEGSPIKNPGPNNKTVTCIWNGNGDFNVQHATSSNMGNGDHSDQKTIRIGYNYGEDLSVIGAIQVNVQPGGYVEGYFKIKNIGEPDSSLDFTIIPPPGNWDIQPGLHYSRLGPGRELDVGIRGNAPDDVAINELKIEVQNDHDSYDREIVPFSINTPKTKSFFRLPFFQFFERYHQLFHWFQTLKEI